MVLLQLGIEPRLVRVAVVPLVIAAVKVGVVETEHTGPPGHRVIAGPVGEGRAVAAFMHGAEAEGQAPAQQQQRRQAQGPGPGGLQPDGGTQHNQAPMARHLTPAGCITAPVELGQPPRADQVGVA
jgi:hypothetical protein